jgi:hypothetical protein
MSNQSLFSRRRPVLPPVLPRGEVLGSYNTHAEAQAAVNALAKAEFPVKQVSIVGSDLKSVERVTGKLSYGRVALAGAASGAWLGIFFGILFFLFSPTGSSVPFVFAALIMGAGFGMLFGIASYAINRRRHDFTSTMQVIASDYQIIVDAELINRARNLLSGLRETEPPAAQTPPAPPTNPQ